MRREIGYLQIRAQTPPTKAQNSGPRRASRNAIQGRRLPTRPSPVRAYALLTRALPAWWPVSAVLGRAY
jgi:hypothetical protein